MVVGATRLKVELRVYDDLGNASLRQELYQQIAASGEADAIFTPSSSAINASYAASEAADVLNIACCTGPASYYHARPLLFGAQLDSDTIPDTFVDKAYAGGARRAAFLYASDDILSVDMCAAARARAVAAGMTVAFERSYLRASAVQSDYSKIIQDMAKTAVDMVVGCTLEADSRGIFRAAVKHGVIKGWPMDDTPVDPAFVETSGVQYLFLSDGPSREAWLREMGGYSALVASQQQWSPADENSDPFFVSSSRLRADWAAWLQMKTLATGAGVQLRPRDRPVLDGPTAAAIASGVMLRLAVEQAGRAGNGTLTRDNVLVAMRGLDSQTLLGRIKLDANQRNVGHIHATVQWDCSGGRTCTRRTVDPDVSGILQKYDASCPTGSFRLYNRASGGDRTCVSCVEVDPYFIETFVTLEPFSTTGVAILASCPIFAYPVQASLQLEGPMATEIMRGVNLSVQEVKDNKAHLANVPFQITDRPRRPFASHISAGGEFFEATLNMSGVGIQLGPPERLQGRAAAQLLLVTGSLSAQVLRCASAACGAMADSFVEEAGDHAIKIKSVITVQDLPPDGRRTVEWERNLLRDTEMECAYGTLVLFVDNKLAEAIYAVAVRDVWDECFSFVACENATLPTNVPKGVHAVRGGAAPRGAAAENAGAASDAMEVVDDAKYSSVALGYDAVLFLAKIWNKVHLAYNNSHTMTNSQLMVAVEQQLPLVDFTSFTGRISFQGRQRQFGAYEFLQYDGYEWEITGHYIISSETEDQVVLPESEGGLSEFGSRDMIIIISGVSFGVVLFAGVTIFYICRYRFNKMRADKSIIERIFLDDSPPKRGFTNLGRGSRLTPPTPTTPIAPAGNAAPPSEKPSNEYREKPSGEKQERRASEKRERRASEKPEKRESEKREYENGENGAMRSAHVGSAQSPPQRSAPSGDKRSAPPGRGGETVRIAKDTSPPPMRRGRDTSPNPRGSWSGRRNSVTERRQSVISNDPVASSPVRGSIKAQWQAAALQSIKVSGRRFGNLPNPADQAEADMVVVGGVGGGGTGMTVLDPWMHQWVRQRGTQVVLATGRAMQNQPLSHATPPPNGTSSAADQISFLPLAAQPAQLMPPPDDAEMHSVPLRALSHLGDLGAGAMRYPDKGAGGGDDKVAMRKAKSYSPTGNIPLDSLRTDSKKRPKLITRTKSMVRATRQFEEHLIRSTMSLKHLTDAPKNGPANLERVASMLGMQPGPMAGEMMVESEGSESDQEEPHVTEERTNRWQRVREAIDHLKKAKADQTLPPLHVEAIQFLEDAVSRIQSKFRSRMYPTRLHHAHLVERLFLEQRIIVGSCRLFVLLMVFVMFWGALFMSVSVEAQRGLFAGYSANFDFPAILSVQTRREFMEVTLPQISKAAKSYFPVSSRYFQVKQDVERGAGPTQMVGEMTYFGGIMEMRGPMFSLSVPTYSWTVWVKARKEFESGFLVRKRTRPTTVSPTDRDTCWGIFFSTEKGPELHYGAHDWFPRDGERVGGWEPGLERVGLESPEARKGWSGLDEEFFLTVVVTNASVTFFRNLERMGSTPLPRPVSDCSTSEGLLIGSKGLELGSLRFYPRGLTESSLEEIASNGGLLSDLTQGSEPEIVELEQQLTDTSISSLVGTSRAVLEAQDKVTSMLTAIDSRPSHTANAHRSANAPTGEIPVNSSSATGTSGDNSSGIADRGFFRLLLGPARLSSTLGESEATQRVLTGIPDFFGTGATISTWFRPGAQTCTTPPCLSVLLEARDLADPFLGTGCFSLGFIGSNLYMKNPTAATKHIMPGAVIPEEFEVQEEKVWRHIAWVFDETSDQIRVFLDGALAFEAPWGSPVNEMHCFAPGADKVMSLGRSSPGYTLGAEAELYDLRLYVHPSGHPLSAAEIRAVAEGVTSGISDETKCLPRGSTRFRDDSWSDLHGHDCTWYAETRVTSPKICEFSSAAAHCPVACRSRQVCYPGNITATKAYYVWDTIRRIEPPLGTGGPTLCLGTDLGTKTQVVDACRDWTETARFGVWWDAGEGEGAWGVYREWAKQAGVTRLDLRSCDDLAAAVDDYCSFDSAPVREFTAASQINGGDFTVTFWVKPSSQQSPDPLTKRFEPSLGFLASLSPPRHNLIVGRFDNASAGGEAVVMDGCDASWTSSVSFPQMPSDAWSLISISRSNAKGVTTLVVSGASVSEQSEAAHGVCPFEAAALFQALEFDRPLLISPITLVPEALPVGKMQDLFYASRKHMAYRTGPAVPRAQTITPKVDIEKADYGQRTMLLSAPVVWQSRRLPTTDCKTKLSGTFIKEQHAKATESFCTGQFSCPSGIEQQPETTLACPAGIAETWPGLDLEAFALSGQLGYGDFLFSIVESPFLLREGQVVPTSDFIDSMTSFVKVFLVFYAPRVGITSLLTVNADFMDDQEVTMKVKLGHFSVLEGNSLLLYTVIQSSCIFLILLMFIDTIFKIRHEYANCKPDPSVPGSTWTFPEASMIFSELTDVLNTAIISQYVFQQIPRRYTSADVAQEIVSGITSIDWASDSLSLIGRKTAYFDQIKSIISLQEEEDGLAVFANMILLVSMLRVVQATNLHPRLGILTGTVSHALDDLFHFVLLVIIVSCCFAAIGVWRFGVERDDFKDFTTTVLTSVTMLMGELPSNWTQTLELALFVEIYIVVVFFLVQNFLLAIIVEAYMTVRAEYVRMQTEQSFPTDAVACFRTSVQIFWYRWPMPGKVAEALEPWNARVSIGFDDLQRTGIFTNGGDKIGKFLQFYKKYDFLEPPRVANRMPIKEGQEVVEEIEKRVAYLFGKAPQTLRGEARVASKLFKKRRMLQKSTSDLAPGSFKWAAARARLSSFEDHELGVGRTASGDYKL